jgi:hypothetical protein
MISLRRFFSLAFSLLAVAVAGTYPQPSHAQATATKPVIEQFYVESDDQLVPGSQLAFTIEGTPGGSASVRISGIKRRIPLQEVDAGVYEGTYAVRSGDRITDTSTARGTLKRRNRSSTALLEESLGVTVASVVAAPVSLPDQLAIESLSVTPVDRLEPGAELRFAMVGTPGGQASFNIEGVASGVPMREVKSGRYEGSYTIRRAEKLTSGTRVTGTLVANGKTLRTSLNQALVVAADRPPIRNISPRDGETLAAGEQVSISGTFDESTGRGIDPKSVKVTVSGTDVSRNSVITPQFFNYRSDLEPGAYPVVVTARDLAGHAVRQAWTFTVAASAAPAGLPLQILSHENNASIGLGQTDIRGRTARDATVDIQVMGYSQIYGAFGYSQKLLSQSLRADANGNFAFSFQPPNASPGARYDVTMTASKGGLSKTATLTLIQQQ